jgi:hypothetical protein
VQVELLPALVNEQWQTINIMEISDKPLADISLPENVLVSANKDHTTSCLQELCPPWSVSRTTDGIYCAAYLVGSEAICRRINTLQSLLEVNRELAVDAAGMLALCMIRTQEQICDIGNTTFFLMPTGVCVVVSPFGL